MIKLVFEPIDEGAILASIKSENAGACVLFSGTTRRFTDELETTTLSYEAYNEMAIAQLEKLRDQALGKWPLINTAIVHRLGEVPIGETSIVVAVSSAHRTDAFAAAEWIMNTIKKDVPIWKKEHWTDGQQQWIHPENPSVDPSQSQ